MKKKCFQKLSSLKEKLLKHLQENQTISLKDFSEKFLFLDFNKNQTAKVARLFIEKESLFETRNDQIVLRKEKRSFKNLDLKEVDFAFIDTETSSFRETPIRIIEIAVVVSKGEDEKIRYSTLLNPLCPISSETLELTKIDPIDISHSPTFEEKWEEIKEILKGKVVVAHNLPFDLGAITRELERFGETFELDFPPICTLKFARKVFKKESCSLDSLCEIAGIKVVERHRALPDALLAKKLFFSLIKYISQKDLAQISSLEDILDFIL
ncbi:MAG: exonuclease domain-containing protein [Acidobacteriota bacterium]